MRIGYKLTIASKISTTKVFERHFCYLKTKKLVLDAKKEPAQQIPLGGSS